MHAKSEGTNKSPKILSAVENKLNTVICWQMGNTSQDKTPPVDFEITTLKNPLINNQVITSIRNLTNYLGLSRNTNLQLNLYSNTLSFNAQISNLRLTICTDPSTWLTPETLNKIFGYKILHFINNEDQKTLGYKTLWRTNVVASHRENKSLGLYIHVWWFLK